MAFVFGVSDMKECNLFVFVVGIGECDQMEICQILSALLHLSNVEVKEQSADRCSISVNTVVLFMYICLCQCWVEDVSVFTQIR